MEKLIHHNRYCVCVTCQHTVRDYLDSMGGAYNLEMPPTYILYSQTYVIKIPEGHSKATGCGLCKHHGCKTSTHS